MKLLFLMMVLLFPAAADDRKGAAPTEDGSATSVASSSPSNFSSAEAADPAPAPPPQPDADKLNVAIYPILAWAPIFRAHALVPTSTPGGGSVSGSTNLSFSGAALFGVDITKKKWLLQGEGLWASVSGSRQTPPVNISTDVVYGDLFIGRKIWRDFSLLGGFRRMAVDLKANVEDLPQFSRKPGVWDPLIGIDWRRQLRRKLYAQVRLDGGGFGVGSDVDIEGDARLEWRFAKHFGALMGYQVLYYQFSGNVSETVTGTTYTYPWKLHQSLNGPIFGFGIYF